MVYISSSLRLHGAAGQKWRTNNGHSCLRIYRTHGSAFGGLESFAGFKLEKGEPLCQEEMEQDQPAKGLGQVALAAQAKAEWAVRLRQGRAETASV